MPAEPYLVEPLIFLSVQKPEAVPPNIKNLSLLIFCSSFCNTGDNTSLVRLRCINLCRKTMPAGSSAQTLLYYKNEKLKGPTDNSIFSMNSLSEA
jgi:hypothetical protein